MCYAIVESAQSRGSHSLNQGSFVEILYLLIPLSVVLVLFIVGGLWWAIYRGQFESVEQEGERILRDD